MDSSTPSPPSRPDDAATALAELRAGNERWRLSHPARPRQNDDVRRELVAGQRPFATILGCVDSRVPSELVFDQGLGDLLNVRTAGQMVDEAALLSIAFGVVSLGTPLVIVLGHSRCGAVTAALEAIDSNTAPPNWLAPFVDQLRPTLPRLQAPQGTSERSEDAVTANVVGVVDRVRRHAAIAPLVEAGTVHVIGAHYELETGAATFLS